MRSFTPALGHFENVMSFAAILSASRMTGESPPSLRASLHFAGQSLVEYQARQAALAGASRVLIVVGVITPALSQAVDRLGADGIAVALVRDMVSLVRDAPRDMDALLVADGAIVGQGHYDALGALEGDALLVTDDSRASATLERIDAGQRWAGLARISPALLFGTLDMIGDWDLASTLVRGAVQKGARRLTVPQDELLEGRAALVESQAQADLAAQAILSRPVRGGRRTSGVEHYLLGPAARWIAPALMRMQVPAIQVRVAGAALAAIGLVPVELQWTGAGLALFLGALLLNAVADRLDALALRRRPTGWPGLLTPAFALLGVALGGASTTALHLMLLLAVLLLADRGERTARLKPWMVMTPGSAVLLLLIAGTAGKFALGIDGVMLATIASVAALILM
jgi:hypothetical protein